MQTLLLKWRAAVLAAMACWATTAAAVGAGWWDSAYLLRKQITVTASTDALASGYSVSLTFDHAALVTALKSLSSGNDIRIVYWNGVSHTEIDRVCDASSSWNNAATKVWFKLQAGIAASGSDNGYWLYYNNAAAGSPPANGMNVYLFWDDFPGSTLDGTK